MNTFTSLCAGVFGSAILIGIAACAPQDGKPTASGSSSSTTTAPAAPQYTGSSKTTSKADATALVVAHNVHRAKHGANGLTWSASLAGRAQDWADRCVFEHSTTSLAVGENLGRWTGSRTSSSMVDLWYDESADYDYAAGTSKNGGVTGHFTQVVWQGTTELGCGISNCPSIGSFLVCNYGPAGNIRGRYTANVSLPN